jgi:hypothetical protein
MSQDIQDLKEAAVFVTKAADAFFKAFKDGFQASDVQVLLNQFVSEDFTKAMNDAWDNIQDIPAEMKDISIKEALELAIAINAELKD